MSRAMRIAFVVAVGVLAIPAIVAAAPDGTATVAFGQPQTGSPFPPPEHDASFNAKDNLVPRTVVISRGGSVTYVISADPAGAGGPHQPAIYAPGTTPEDISILGPGPFVNDPDGRIGLGPLVGAGTQTWPSPALAQPGRYLVICNFMPHFAFAKMYGWVNVK